MQLSWQLCENWWLVIAVQVKKLQINCSTPLHGASEPVVEHGMILPQKLRWQLRCTKLTITLASGKFAFICNAYANFQFMYDVFCRKCFMLCFIFCKIQMKVWDLRPLSWHGHYHKNMSFGCSVVKTQTRYFKVTFTVTGLSGYWFCSIP